MNNLVVATQKIDTKFVAITVEVRQPLDATLPLSRHF